MTPEKAVEVSQRLLVKLEIQFPEIKAQRQNIDSLEFTLEQSVAHYKHVAKSIILHVGDGKYKKAQRWIGFLQCGMSPFKTLGMLTIRQIGEMNVSENPNPNEFN